ncbi:hypothetical protein E2C01_091394 [Portunus trituberculatus]|uniref:Uncharacterized protein n=1 Tax=Portunus trituberculatus TaxID=210409 RepID=A0A5B7JIY3_PORTR|nr:hypothetical protein [Portunus trituberculatus]
MTYRSASSVLGCDEPTAVRELLMCYAAFGSQTRRRSHTDQPTDRPQLKRPVDQGAMARWACGDSPSAATLPWLGRSGAPWVLMCHVIPGTASTCPFMAITRKHENNKVISISAVETQQLIWINITQNVRVMNY